MYISKATKARHIHKKVHINSKPIRVRIARLSLGGGAVGGIWGGGHDIIGIAMSLPGYNPEVTKGYL